MKLFEKSYKDTNRLHAAKQLWVDFSFLNPLKSSLLQET